MAGGPLESRISGVEHEAQELKEAVERMASNHSGIQNNQPININAGGVGIWIATTACLVMLSAMFIGAFWVSREFDRTDKELNERKEENQRMQTYLNAIYVNAPQLKPADYEQKQNEQKAGR